MKLTLPDLVYLILLGFFFGVGTSLGQWLVQWSYAHFVLHQ
jgi:hypothetical protein